MSGAERLKEQLNKLSLHAIRDRFEDEAKKAAKTKLSYTGYLAKLVEEESLARAERSINARVAKAKFSAMKTMEGFEFSFQPSLEEGLVRELRRLYKIPLRQVVGHRELPGATGVCPGPAFPRRILQRLRGEEEH